MTNMELLEVKPSRPGRFEEIPNEVILDNIFRHTSAKAVVAFSGVNRRFNALAVSETSPSMRTNRPSANLPPSCGQTFDITLRCQFFDHREALVTLGPKAVLAVSLLPTINPSWRF